MAKNIDVVLKIPSQEHIDPTTIFNHVLLAKVLPAKIKVLHGQKIIVEIPKDVCATQSAPTLKNSIVQSARNYFSP